MTGDQGQVGGAILRGDACAAAPMCRLPTQLNVVALKGVTVRTVSRSSALPARCATHVLSVSDDVEMRRVHARRVAAEVVDLEPSRDIPANESKRDAVCGHTPPSNLQATVAARTQFTGPQPAAAVGLSLI
jgi:hypothetical protein